MAADGMVGIVRDVYFDDRWAVRYLAVHTCEAFSGQRILISAQCLFGGYATRDRIFLTMSGDQVRDAMDTSNTGADYAAGITDRVESMVHDASMRSAGEVAGYSITARDGPIGSIQDLVVDDRAWCVTELVADTRSWLPGKPTLISPDAVDCIESSKHSVRIRLTREEVERSPRVH